MLRGKRIFKLSRLNFLSHPNNKFALGNKFKHPNPKKEKNDAAYINNRGYKYVKNKKYADCKNGWELYKMEHTLIIEKHIGRKLIRDNRGKGEGVHHINGDKLDNNIDNLTLYKDENEHRKIHNQLEKISFELVKIGIIKFNKLTKTYYI